MTFYNPFQGFSIQNNLIESTNDRELLNNIGVAPIADDINLFQNNSNNSSDLVVDVGDISGDTINLGNDIGFVFTNSTMVTVDQTDYYVRDSNNVNQFRLSTQPDLSDLVPAAPAGTYSRRDTVTHDNIKNFFRERRRAIDDMKLSEFGTGNISSIENNISFSTVNIFDSVIDTYTIIFSSSTYNLARYLFEIEENIDYFNLKKTSSIIRNRDYSTVDQTTIDGYINVLDTDGSNTGEVLPENPGIFILDSVTGNFARIFSLNDNVWQEDITDLIAETREISVSSLKFDTTVKLLDSSSTGLVETHTANDLLDFTHFKQVVINGEYYNLCVKLN